MRLEQIAGLGRKRTSFLGLFADCFGRREARGLLRVYVQGQLSNLHRKTAEAIKGPEVWEVQWAVFWRKGEEGLPTRRHCLIVARSVLTGEVKYFLSNRVPGEQNPVTGQWITLRWLL